MKASKHIVAGRFNEIYSRLDDLSRRRRPKAGYRRVCFYSNDRDYERFLNVQSLELKRKPVICDGQQDFTAYAIEGFLKLLCEHLPNLQHLKISLHSSVKCRGWYVEMIKFNPQMFGFLPANLKGSLRFYIEEWKTPFKDVSLAFTLNSIFNLSRSGIPSISKCRKIEKKHFSK